MTDTEIPEGYMPGPWRLEEQQTEEGIQYSIWSEDGYCIALDDDQCDPTQFQNLRLITLAPTMAAEIARQREVIAGLRGFLTRIVCEPRAAAHGLASQGLQYLAERDAALTRAQSGDGEGGEG